MIIGGEGPDPSPTQVIELDDQLADQGIPVLRRPLEAAKLWGDQCGNPMLGLTKEGWFRESYRKLHPSVPFDSASFLTLCISARGVSYVIRPPMAYGRVGIKPLDHTDITEQEVARLWHAHRTAFWELNWQAFDAIDLFMSKVNFYPAVSAATNMMETAVNQLTASARQLVACEIDSSLPQGMILACELAGKAVLLHTGATPELLRQVGHNLSRLVDEVSTRLPSPIDETVRRVVNTLPPYVAVRYESPHMTMIDAQDIFRKAMFVVADFLRRTNHDQGYWTKVNEGSMPTRDI